MSDPTGAPEPQRERIVCGHSHPDARMNDDINALREDAGASPDNAGCGRAGIWPVMYRCAECARWFHRDCIRKHFAAHKTAGAPEPSEAGITAVLDKLVGKVDPYGYLNPDQRDALYSQKRAVIRDALRVYLAIDFPRLPAAREPEREGDLLRIVRQIVDRQAEDLGLWYEAQTAPEAYVQSQLRVLHAAVERATGGETGPERGPSA